MSCKFFSISTYDYLRNTCLHYIDELELVMCHPMLLNTLLQILSLSGVVEFTTQLLILENILWLPLCQVNNFGSNTLPLKTVATPYTCGLSRPFSGTVAGEHSSIL